MHRALILAAALLLAAAQVPAPVGGDMSNTTVKATGGTTAIKQADRAAERINVKDFGAKGDANGWQDGTMAAGSSTLTSALATFTAADVGKAIAIFGSGTAAAAQPGTITSVNSAHSVGVSFTAALNTPANGLQYVLVVAKGTGYAPGDTISPVGGTGVQQAPVVTVAATAAVAGTTAAGGASGVGTSCTTITGTTGTGHPFVATGTIAGGALTGALTVTYQGAYTVNPTNIAAEPVTGCSLVGARVSLTMGALGVQLTNPGAWTAPPSSPAATTSSGSGMGVTLTLVSAVTGGIFQYGTDDSPAIAAAINRANALAAIGNRAAVYFPAGNYLVKSTPLPVFQRIGTAVIGEGPHVSGIVVDPTYAGAAVLSWHEAWLGSSYGGPALWLGNDFAGPSVKGMSISGFQYIPQRQDGIMFYARNDNVSIEDTDVRFLNGRCLGIGFPTPGGSDTIAWVRESRITMRCLNTGTPTLPSVEVDSFATGAGDTTNQIEFRNLQILDQRGTGLLVHNSSNTNKGTGALRFFGLRVESFEGLGGDLIQIGNNVGDTGANVSGTKIYGLLTNGVNQGFSSLRFTAPVVSTTLFDVSVDGGIYSGFGDGVTFDGGERIDIRLHENAAAGTKFYMAATPQTGANIRIDMAGRERFFPWQIDTTALPNFSIPPYGSVGSPQLNFANIVPSINGNQTSGTANTVGGGFVNNANNNGNTVSGGYNNVASGQYSVIPGGRLATDRGHIGAECYASGTLASQGDAQRCEYVLRGTTSTTATVTLTSDGLAPGAVAGASNCVNIPTLTVYSLLIEVVASDRSNLANNETWNLWAGKLHRPTSAATTAIVMASKPTPLTSGTVAGSDIAAAADTTNGCLSLVFTPPTANAVRWDVVARVKTVQVQ